jgi:hypothetical protein
MELNKENKMKSEQAVLPNPCLDEEEEEDLISSQSFKWPLSNFYSETL